MSASKHKNDHSNENGEKLQVLWSPLEANENIWNDVYLSFKNLISFNFSI